jgi:hypothetical protein
MLIRIWVRVCRSPAIASLAGAQPGSSQDVAKLRWDHRGRSSEQQVKLVPLQFESALGRNRSLYREHRRFESHAGGHATRTSIFVSKQTTTISLQIVVCIAHHRNHRSTLGARLCAVRPDASSLLVPTGVRQTVRLLPVECFRGASAAMSGSLANPAKSLKSWRAREDSNF